MLEKFFQDVKYLLGYKKISGGGDGEKAILTLLQGPSIFLSDNFASAGKLKRALSMMGKNVEIIHMPVVKPVDKDTLIASAKKTNRVFTIENHSIIGAVGSAVCETLSENYPVKVTRIGISDEFGQSGEQRELMKHYRLTGGCLAERILEVL